MATYGIFGWIFTLYRAITSMTIAIVAGILTNIFDKDEEIKVSRTFSMNKPIIDKEESCGTGTGSCCSTKTASKKFSLIVAIKYAFGTLLGDIVKPLFWEHLSL